MVDGWQAQSIELLGDSVDNVLRNGLRISAELNQAKHARTSIDAAFGDLLQIGINENVAWEKWAVSGNSTRAYLTFWKKYQELQEMSKCVRSVGFFSWLTVYKVPERIFTGRFWIRPHVGCASFHSSSICSIITWHYRKSIFSYLFHSASVYISFCGYYCYYNLVKRVFSLLTNWTGFAN